METLIRQMIRQVETEELESPAVFLKWKRQMAKQHAMPMPANRDILREYYKYIKKNALKPSDQIVRLLRIRKIRTLSGIAPIGVHTRPMGCPGKCVYCPTEARMPKSYLSNQPAVMRAIANEFEPEAMVRNRLLQLERNGHETNKNELIVMGGTWSAHPRPYQEMFIQKCFDGFNGRPSDNLEQAQQWNETAEHRCVGLTLETRPDWVDEAEVARWVRYGATRCELGCQHTDSEVLATIQRGHDAAATIRATRLFKQAGFKVTYHLMPGLPGSNPDRDLQMFQTLFSDEDFQPDQIKIYPCVVNEHAELYQWWKEGKFVPYDDATLMALLPKAKQLVPPYVRISRLFRDIPGESIQAGSRVTNIRQMVQDQMNAAGQRCRCLRCREPRANIFDAESIKLKVRRYPASGGEEIFLSYETPDEHTVLAFLRLRFNDEAATKAHFLPVLNGCAIVRELHTYGEVVRLHERGGKVQHQGWGRRLMAKAEELTRHRGITRLAVISGVGVREYYRKLGYELKEGFMVKGV